MWFKDKKSRTFSRSNITAGWAERDKKELKKNMAVEPVAIAGGMANITAGAEVAKDMAVTGGNFLVTNTVGAFMLGMVGLAFGVALVVKLVRGRRGRR